MLHRQLSLQSTHISIDTHSPHKHHSNNPLFPLHHPLSDKNRTKQWPCTLHTDSPRFPFTLSQFRPETETNRSETKRNETKTESVIHRRCRCPINIDFVHFQKINSSKIAPSECGERQPNDDKNYEEQSPLEYCINGAIIEMRPSNDDTFKNGVCWIEWNTVSAQSLTLSLCSLSATMAMAPSFIIRSGRHKSNSKNL